MKQDFIIISNKPSPIFIQCLMQNLALLNDQQNFQIVAWDSNVEGLGTQFPEMCAIVRARAGTHVSKFACAIYCMHSIKVFSLFDLLYTFHKEKCFIEGFFIEDYIQEI